MPRFGRLIQSVPWPRTSGFPSSRRQMSLFVPIPASLCLTWALSVSLCVSSRVICLRVLKPPRCWWVRNLEVVSMRSLTSSLVSAMTSAVARRGCPTASP